MRQELNTYTENCRSKRGRTSKRQVEVQEHHGQDRIQDRISGVSRWKIGSIYKSAFKKLSILSVLSKQEKRNEMTEKMNLQQERERERVQIQKDAIIICKYCRFKVRRRASPA